MKQAKFALTAVAVLAVIGGALAFKANIGTANFFYKTNQDCTVPTAIPYTTTASGVYITNLGTTTKLGDCPVVTLRTLA